MSETQQETRSLVVFVPPGLEQHEVVPWRDAIVEELSEAGIVDESNRELWQQVLDQTGSEELPDQASGAMLLVSEASDPIYVWVTMAQPASNPIALGEAVLDTQFPELGRGETLDEAGTGIHQGYRVGRRPLADGAEVFVQFTVTVATLDLEDIGDVDVCLWFGTDQLETVNELLPVVANLMHDPNLAAYLMAA